MSVNPPSYITAGQSGVWPLSGSGTSTRTGRVDMKNKQYNAYLASEHWDVTRKRIRKRDGYNCVLCEEPVQEVHHINYRTMTDVWDHDLMSTCQPCHSLIHRAIVAGYIPDPYLNESSLALTKTGLAEYHQARGMGKGTVLSRTFVFKLADLSQSDKCRIWTWAKRKQGSSLLQMEGVYVSRGLYRRLVRLVKANQRSSLHIP